MVFLEMLLEGIVIEIVVWLPRVSPVADEAPLMLVSAMLVQFVAVIKPGTAEAAQRMPSETRLINCAGFVVAVSHMFGQLLIRKQVMFVRKDLLVPGAQVAHLLVVDGADMAMQVLPAKACKVALGIGAVISQEKDSIANNILARIFDANVVVSAGDVGVFVFVKTLSPVVGENDKRGGRLYKARLASSSPLKFLVTPRTRQCGQSLFLYRALIRSAQMWQVM
jgi:hypothetical protein